MKTIGLIGGMSWESSDVYYQELVKGIIDDRSRQRFVEIIEKLIMNGAEAIIAGCTEIELLIPPGDISVDLFQTTKIHAEKAVEIALRP